VTRLQRLTSPVAASLSPLATLTYAEPQQLHLRDGEVVIYRRGDSPLWQCRFKLADGTWHRVSTKRASIEAAVAAATDLYDQARYRQRLGLAHKAQNFAQIAAATLHDLRRQLDAGIGKSVYHSYITCIERYFLPFFAEHYLEAITHSDILEFEVWRNRQMAKTPKASTLNNFASAWSRLCQTAVERGWISSQVPVPKLSTRGRKSTPRPAFDRDEVDKLLAFMEGWSREGRLAVEREIRPLLRDYVEILLYTGMRHGTEAMGLCWNHISWHTHEGKKYLRLWVSGKTGGRWLIAKHKAIDALTRLQQRQSKLASLTFDELLSSRVKAPVFVTSGGYQPHRIDGTFKRLLRDSGLEIGETGQRRTLYSLRHTYATQELLAGRASIHDLENQMGTSISMIQKHYSKASVHLVAERLAESGRKN
jgi:integrase